MNSCINQMSLVKGIFKNLFRVPIGNANNTEMRDFHPRAPEIK